MKDRPPNVLLILCDEMRQMAMSHAGDTNLSTPNLDRLAREGAAWNRVFTPSPVCCPARSALYFDRHAQHLPLLIPPHRQDRLNDVLRGAARAVSPATTESRKTKPEPTT